MPSSPGYKRNYKQYESCLNCKNIFDKTRSTHKFCCTKCKGKYKYITGAASTNQQYKYISGNWDKYFNRILYKRRKESGITKEILIEVLKKQNYKCALTNKKLTCILSAKDGPCPTNASIDRILAGGPYSIENIQLVCRAVNSFRNNMPLDDFIEWCRSVAETHKAVRKDHVQTQLEARVQDAGFAGGA